MSDLHKSIRAPRRHWPIVTRVGITLTITLGLAGLTLPAHAQQGTGDGFLFSPPAGTLTLRLGLARADATSDIFTFSREELTLSRRDFDGPTLGFDYAIRLRDRLDIVLSAGYIGARADSEFRDWVDDSDDSAIEQVTHFQRVPLTASVRFYLFPTGRTIGSFAWIPTRFAPYLGIGGGTVWYRFSQSGEFIDYETLDIFDENFIATGWALAGHWLAGFDLSLDPRWALSAEARYSSARKEMGGPFRGFQPIDLSGLSTTVGIQFRF